MTNGTIETFSRTTGPADRRCVAVLHINPTRGFTDCFYAATEEEARTAAEHYFAMLLYGPALREAMKQLRLNLKGQGLD